MVLQYHNFLLQPIGGTTIPRLSIATNQWYYDTATVYCHQSVVLQYRNCLLPPIGSTTIPQLSIATDRWYCMHAILQLSIVTNWWYYNTVTVYCHQSVVDVYYDTATVYCHQSVVLQYRNCLLPPIDGSYYDPITDNSDFHKESSMGEWRQLRGLFLYWISSKVVQPQRSLY